MWEPGRQVDRYVIRRLLGEGGMADVYLAEHDVLRTSVAIKVLHGRPSVQLRERLLREGRVQASLQHPNLVRVLDVLDVDGNAALVMDFVDGPTLHDVLREGPLPLARVEAILVELVAGLEAAHAAGVVHRDLKPANVLLAGGVTPVITDFGLAALMDSDERRLTRAGVGLGTPNYMAPEQVTDARSVDRRADVFALAVVTYELLVGAPPVEGPVLSVVYLLAQGRWTPATARVTGLPARVDDALRWALAPSVVDRCPSAAAFLERFLGGAPPSPDRRPPAPASPVSRPSRTRALLGREVELEAAAARFDARGGLLVVVGPPGVGKTRLAAEVAARWGEARGEGSRAWVDLSPLDTLEGVQQQVAAAVDAPADRPLGASLSRRGAYLLVLDNLEHLPRELGPWLDQLTDAAPSLRVLATTRELPAATTSEALELAPLPVEAADPRTTAAWHLFSAAAPPGTLSGVSASLAGQLLVALDGLPLCLELAAARLEVLDPEELLARLGSPTRVLRVPGAEGRHDALVATLRWSWSLLRPEEQRALAWLSVFRGAFGLAEAEALLERGRVSEPLDAVHGLVRRNLLRRDQRRFVLLRSIRDFATSQLGADASLARVAFGEVVIPLALRARQDRDTRARHRALLALAPELEAILTWSDDLPALYEPALAAAVALTALYHDLGPQRAIRRMATEGLLRAPPGHPERFRLLVSRALASRRLGDRPAAVRDLEEASAAAVDDEHRAMALVHRADLALELDHEAGALDWYREGLALAQRAGVAHLVVSAASSLATIGEDAQVAAEWLAVGRAAVPADDPLSLLRWTKSAAWVAVRMGRMTEALGLYGELRAQAQELGDQRTEAYAAAQSGLAAEASGDLAGAEPHFRAATSWFREEGDPAYAGYYRGALGRVLARAGRWEEAEEAFVEAGRDAVDPYRVSFRRWAAIARARRISTPAPDAEWGWLFDAFDAKHRGDRAGVRTHLEGHPPVSSLVDGPLVAQVVGELLAEAGAWRIAEDGTAFETPDGARVELSRHPANARILACLLAARAAGALVDAAELAEAGWPGERIVPAAGANRVRVALSHLRKVGLEPLIERAEGGWRLRSGVSVVALSP
jgi:tetratricopeptide (TPR) repeat protein